MSEELEDVLADALTDVLADPTRLLTADREALRDHLAAAEHDAESVGGEVFLQAEAIFGGAEVSTAEFASWLHFAAKATGYEEYAERIAKAEPGMPWRTVWAWWRPANWFLAQPSLNEYVFTRMETWKILRDCAPKDHLRDGPQGCREPGHIGWSAVIRRQPIRCPRNPDPRRIRVPSDLRPRSPSRCPRPTATGCGGHLRVRRAY